jgi:hypothetical protein
VSHAEELKRGRRWLLRRDRGKKERKGVGGQRDTWGRMGEGPCGRHRQRRAAHDRHVVRAMFEGEERGRRGPERVGCYGPAGVDRLKRTVSLLIYSNYFQKDLN